MRRDPVLFALVFAVAAALGTVTYVVGSVLADSPTSPVPWNADRAEAQETWETIQRGLHAVPQAQ